MQQQHGRGSVGSGYSRGGSGVTNIVTNARKSSYLADNSGSYKDKKSEEEGGTSTNKTISKYCCIWPLSLLNDKAIWRLFLVMFLNGSSPWSARPSSSPSRSHLRYGIVMCR